MADRASPDTLNSLHEACARLLLARIRSGDATAAEITAAIKLLKDNEITTAPPQDDHQVSLLDDLPFVDGHGRMNS